MRTLTFGDRTISYDTGLDMEGATGPMTSLPTAMFTNQRKVSASYSEADSGVGSECSEDPEDVDTERKLIKPDIMAVSQLLNFDEEEEDELKDNETEESDDEVPKSNEEWKKVIVKDLATFKMNDSLLKRRHSISKCETETIKSTAIKRKSQSKSSPFSSFAAVPVPHNLSTQSQKTTLCLSLSEAGHIRSAIAKAELEASTLEETVKQSIEQGKICTVCTNTRFGMFCRGQKCEVCRQTVCFKCFSRMRIPTDNQCSSNHSSSQYSLCGVSNCAGSAPNTPQTKKKNPLVTLSTKQLLDEQLKSLPAQNKSSLPQPSHPLLRSKYFTLPKLMVRQWSMIYNREMDREKLEGSLLLVCTACMDMVKQVIRVDGQKRRLKNKMKMKMQ